MTFKDEQDYSELEFCENLSEEEMNRVQGGLTIAHRPFDYEDKHPTPEPFPFHPIEPIHPPIYRPIHQPIYPPIYPIGRPITFPIHKPRHRPYLETH